MLRRLLLAVLFCLATWAVVDRTSANSADSFCQTDAISSIDAAIDAATTATATTASIGKTVATPPLDTHPPEARWEVLLPQGIGGGSSREPQSQAQAADLPGVSSRVPWPVARRARDASHAAHFRPAHLLHTPLLI